MPHQEIEMIFPRASAFAIPPVAAP